MQFDLPAGQLENHRSAVPDPEDFDEFWGETLADARAHDLGLSVEEVASPLTSMRVFDVAFRGFGGHEVRAWLRVPHRPVVEGATVVQFHGYTGGRGEPIEELVLPSSGYVHFSMDTRGQGWNVRRSATHDPVGPGVGAPARLTYGIESRESYFYRRLFTDAVRAVEAARQFEFVDPGNVAVSGTSQGGGVALAAAGLVGDLRAVVTRVPFLADISRAIRMTDAAPYSELASYFSLYRDRVAHIEREVLPYFDVVNHARRATAPAQFSVGLMDPVCPPSTVYGAFNAYAGPKDIQVWEFNRHEGGGVDDDLLALRHLARHLVR